MGRLDLLVIAIGVAMDAFAVAICKGLVIDKMKIKYIFFIGLYFGGFQVLMPLIGYLFGKTFSSYITAIDHWVAFTLLFVVGLNMIMEKDKNEKLDESFSLNSMIGFAIATSIDALAAGVTFATLGVSILVSVLVIGIITFIISGCGLVIGYQFGSKFKSKAGLMGGILLVFIAFEILLDHLNMV